MHINPDHFLQTANGRVLTPERNQMAWAKAYEALEAALSAATPHTIVYVLVGAQGAGKSTWARSMAAQFPHAIVFDAILVKRAERRPIIEAANARSVPVVAVWFSAPLDVCLARNAARPSDEVVSERALRNVFSALEPPSINEGFAQITEVSGGGPRDTTKPR